MALRSFVCLTNLLKNSNYRCSVSTIIATFATTTLNIPTLMNILFSKKSTREQRIYRVTATGIIINALLLTFKFTVGILGVLAATIADLYRAAIHERNAYRQNGEYII